ncbi:MAG: copper amine oxidase N-terminal domain-containing protein [Peptococcaceae bacterium]|nr:copper amine oxidase N-terminal domain-containing protein [Peptococcaceae bacterium]
MNKISKKIISLVTMAAFVLTLVPAAAFADTVDLNNENTQVTLDDQKIVLSNDTSNPTASAEATVKVGTTALNSLNDRVVLWVTDKEGNVLTSDKVTLSTDAAHTGKLDSSYASSIGAGSWGPAWWLHDVSASSEVKITLTFKSAGTYTLNTAYYNGQNQADFAAIKAGGQEVGTVTVVKASDVVNVAKSALLINGSQATAAATQGTDAQAEFMVIGNDSKVSSYPLNAASGDAVYVWAELNNRVVDDATFGDVYATATDKKNDIAPIGKAVPTNVKDVWKLVDNDGNALSVKDGYVVDFNFNDNGNGYQIFAGVADDSLSTSNSVADIDEVEPITVNVAAATVKTSEITFTNDVTDATVAAVAGKDGEYTYTINDDVTPSDVKVYKVNGQALTEDGTAAANEELNVTAKRGITLKGLSDEGTVTTNARGEFSFEFTLAENGEFDIEVSEINGDASSTLTVVQDMFYVGNIKTVKDGGYLLAGNDTKHDTTEVGTSDYFADAVQFELTDVNGNKVTGVTPNTNAYTLTVDAPKDSDLTADELQLVWDAANEVYTLQYNDKNSDGKTKDLTPGEYTVKVAFKSSEKAATATFNLAKFGTVQEITTDLVAIAGWPNNNNNAIKAIDDEIALGQTVKGTAYLVDENGIKVKADGDDLNIGINGSNSASVVAKDANDNPFYFTLASNTAANESLIGSTVTVKVFDETHQKYVEKTLTIVKGYLAETLSFDPIEGPINEDNTVAVSVVDENDKLSKVNGDLYAYIEKQSNADAYVDLKINNENVKDGKGELTLYSDQEGTVDVVVVVKADNGEMYGKTLTYTFGAVDPAAQNTVVMTIGSTDYVVNNDIISGDAAPYVDSNWRTMVPFRVLGETFGATVDWDQDNKTVTYTYGNTTLTMTIGSTTYTVNGEDKTMDTAPVLNGDRTYVPVRFVAEALGYEVTPLQDSTGLTASVVFQK